MEHIFTSSILLTYHSVFPHSNWITTSVITFSLLLVYILPHNCLASLDLGEAFENEETNIGADILFTTKEFLKKKNTLPPLEPPHPRTPDDDSRTYPIQVGIELHVESIRDIAGDATMDLYMIETWTDWREAGKYNHTIKMSGKGTVNFCWIPDTYFILARSIYYSPSSQSLTVQKDGKVFLDRKIRLVTPCTPEVWFFPFDVTTCKILISSYGYEEDEMDLYWQETGIDFPFEYEPLSEMGFKMIGMKTKKFAAPYGTSNFTILEGQIELKRLYSVYIYQIYIPAALLVLLSWVSFFINRNATPARASVGVTTVLTMLTLATQSQQNMEKHITLETSLLDVYIWVSFSFVIAAMMEFAVSDYFNDRKTRAKNKPRPAVKPQIYENHNNNNLNPIHNNIGGGPHPSIPLIRNSDSGAQPPVEKNSISIDGAARIFFPLTFFIFNTSYWIYVFIHSQKSDDT